MPDLARAQTGPASTRAETASAQATCLQVTRALRLGSRDHGDRTGNVSRIQAFLNARHGNVAATGKFDKATETALKAWQAANGVVSSGSPRTTGYGVVGPRTRRTLRAGCPALQSGHSTTALQLTATAGYSAVLVASLPPHKGKGDRTMALWGSSQPEVH